VAHSTLRHTRVCSLQEKLTQPLSNSMSAFQDKHDSLINALYSSTFHMPVSEVDLDESEFLNELRTSDRLMTRLHGLVANLGDQERKVAQFAQQSKGLKETVQEEILELSRTKRLLLALSALGSVDQSLTVQKVQSGVVLYPQ